MEICNLTKQSIVCDAGFLQELERVKAEAFKEFATDLKENGYYNIKGEIIVFGEDIDSLLQEKVGDNDV